MKDTNAVCDDLEGDRGTDMPEFSPIQFNETDACHLLTEVKVDIFFTCLFFDFDLCVRGMLVHFLSDLNSNSF